MTKNEHRYSLWLRPAQTQIDELTQIISRLAHDYETAPFPPHATLLSKTTAQLSTIKQACKKIANKTQGFDLPLQKIGYAETYYRNFFILAEPVQTLSEIYMHAKEALAYEVNENFIPHLSLLYGSLDLKTKRKLKQELEGTYPAMLHCQRLDLYDTSGKVADWSLVESYVFTKTRKRNYK